MKASEKSEALSTAQSLLAASAEVPAGWTLLDAASPWWQAYCYQGRKLYLTHLGRLWVAQEAVGAAGVGRMVGSGETLEATQLAAQDYYARRGCEQDWPATARRGGCCPG